MFQSGITIVDGAKEAIVGGEFLGLLPGPFNGIEVWGIRWETKQFDAMAIAPKPLFALIGKIVARTIVDDEKCLATSTSDELLQKRQK